MPEQHPASGVEFALLEDNAHRSPARFQSLMRVLRGQRAARLAILSQEPT
jgi:hypothetical protein